MINYIYRAVVSNQKSVTLITLSDEYNSGFPTVVNHQLSANMVLVFFLCFTA